MAAEDDIRVSVTEDREEGGSVDYDKRRRLGQYEEELMIKV